MSKRSRLIYILFARFPIFTMFHAGFTLMIIATYSISAYAYYAAYFAPVFVVMILLREGISNSRAAAALQILFTAAVSAVIIYTAPVLGVRNFMLVYTALLLINSLRKWTPDLDSPMIISAVATNAALTLLFSMVETRLTRHGSWASGTTYSGINDVYHIFLVSLIITVICHLMCVYYRGFEGLANSKRLARQAGNVANAITRRSSVYLYGYVIIITALLIVTFSQSIPKSIIIPEKERVPNPITTPAPRRIWERGAPEISLIEEQVEPGELFYFGSRYGTDEVGEVEIKYEDYTTPITIAVACILLTAVIILAIFYKKPAPENPDGDDLFSGFDEEAIAFTRLRRKALKAVPSTNQAVRAILVKKVSEHRRHGLALKKDSTAKSITAKINETENVSLLDSLYHTARYSPDTVSKADLARLRKQLKD